MREKPFIEWIGKNSGLSEADLERALQVKSNCAGCFHMLLRVDKTRERISAVPHCRASGKFRFRDFIFPDDFPLIKQTCADALSFDQDEKCTNKMSASLAPDASLEFIFSSAFSSGISAEELSGFNERALAEIEPLRASEKLMKSY